MYGLSLKRRMETRGGLEYNNDPERNMSMAVSRSVDRFWTVDSERDQQLIACAQAASVPVSVQGANSNSYSFDIHMDEAIRWMNHGYTDSPYVACCASRPRMHFSVPRIETGKLERWSLEFSRWKTQEVAQSNAKCLWTLTDDAVLCRMLQSTD